MRTLGNHLRKSGEVEKTLARVAEKVVASLPPFLATNPSVSLPLLKTLVAPPHGSHSFDARTIEKVVAKLDLKGVRGWVKYLKEFVIGEEAKLLGDGETENVIEAEDEKAVSNRRIWAFDQLLHVAKSGALPKDDETLAGLLEFFAVLGWFEVRKSGKGAVSLFFSSTSVSATHGVSPTAILRAESRLHDRSPKRRSISILLRPYFSPDYSLHLRPKLALSSARPPRELVCRLETLQLHR